MTDAIGSWSNRSVEVGGIDDVGLWEPVTGVRQLWAGFDQPNGTRQEPYVRRSAHINTPMGRMNTHLTKDAFLQSLSAPL